MRTLLLSAALLTVPLAVPTAVLPPAADAALAALSGRPHLSSRLAAFVAARDDGLGRTATARRMGLAKTGPGSLLRTTDGSRLVVTVRFATYDAAAVAAVEAAGAEVVSRSPELDRVTVTVDPDDLTALGEVPGVQYVGDQLAPVTRATCDTTVSEGDTLLQASSLRSAHAVDGTGVTVGVLSDSFSSTTSPTSAAQDVASDNLPGSTNTCGHTTPVRVGSQVTAGQGGEDEGRAMAQVVHDLAPGAAIDFESASLGEDAFADSIDTLVSEGAQVIVDDVGYFDEPMYQDGVVAEAASRARAAGVTYVSAAGNDGYTLNGLQVGSYEAVGGYRPTTCPTAVTTSYTAADCHDFDTSGAADPTYTFTGSNSAWTLTPVLQWAEPYGGVTTDLDLYLVDETRGTVVAKSTDTNTGSRGSQESFEYLSYTPNASYRTDRYSLVVARKSAAAPATTPRFKVVFAENGDTPFASVEHATATGTDVMGPTLFGHSGSADVLSVGAASVTTSPTAVDAYSSSGPVTTLFGPVTGSTPAAALSTPVVVQKPDLVATDCARNTFFGTQVSGTYRFCGTSQAAPHAAAVAALLRQEAPSVGVDAVWSAMTGTATPIAGATAAAQGAGLVDALAAGDALGARTTSTGTSTGTAPDTTLTKHPAKRVTTSTRKTRVTFRFAASTAGATFACSVDGGAYRACTSATKVKVRPGRHTFAVRASLAGLTDPTPAKVRFRVVRRAARR